MGPNLSRIVVAVSLGLIITGCQTANIQPQSQSTTISPTQETSVQDLARWRSDHRNTVKAPPEPEVAKDLWSLTRNHLELEPGIDQPRVDKLLDWYRSHDSFIRHASDRATLYYHYVLTEVLKRDMPAEVALLPFIESGYNPLAVSPSKAAGAWQFIPSTARLFNLKENWWYDGRRDIVASTDAALDYLQYLNDRFDGDWLLSFAAYNCGEGCVSRAVKRNLKAGKAGDYWSLSLPRETQRYVPKLIAVARLVKNAPQYNIDLPAMPNTPYFEVVTVDSQLELNKAASMAGIDLATLKKLNPGFKQWATDPEGPHRLLVPVASAQRFTTALTQTPPGERVSWTRYAIRRGDTLSRIASQFDTTVSAIRTSNRLTSNRIRAGKTLLIPTQPGKSAAAVASAGDKRVHTVRNGDNLWKIARRYGVSADQLADWNRISDARTLRPGQDLILYSDSQNPG
ncbi:LysM peptidoglycan-binding domain-containing protein [Marinobacterium sp. YM272]|uniref:LysM peptidoglycan-binding domain-containing protein n=1 Tax=Marinobacterium sp. YM272 TaxID=3421654 RepID=UPI003D7FEF27